MTGYNEDFHAWALEAAQRAKNRQLLEEDYDWIAEELESMGKRERRDLVSRLTVTLIHLLKWQYAFDPRDRAGWENTLLEQRDQIERVLADNPSLKPQLPQAIEEAYPSAYRRAAAQSGKPRTDFPATFAETGWTWAQVLDLDFYPRPQEPQS